MVRRSRGPALERPHSPTAFIEGRGIHGYSDKTIALITNSSIDLRWRKQFCEGSVYVLHGTCAELLQREWRLFYIGRNCDADEAGVCGIGARACSITSGTSRPSTWAAQSCRSRRRIFLSLANAALRLQREPSVDSMAMFIGQE